MSEFLVKDKVFRQVPSCPALSIAEDGTLALTENLWEDKFVELSWKKWESKSRGPKWVYKYGANEVVKHRALYEAWIAKKKLHYSDRIYPIEGNLFDNCEVDNLVINKRPNFHSEWLKDKGRTRNFYRGIYYHKQMKKYAASVIKEYKGKRRNNCNVLYDEDQKIAAIKRHRWILDNPEYSDQICENAKKLYELAVDGDMIDVSKIPCDS